jgi:protein SCO1/2
MEQVTENPRHIKLVFPKLLWLVAFLLLLALVESLFYGNLFNTKSQYPEVIREVVYPDLQSLHDFNLVDHDNHALGLQQLAGRWTFLFFGYTHCPDICPATLSQLTRLSQSIQDHAAGDALPAFLFVSVDPARDKVDVIHDYIHYFDESFIAATGDINNIEAFEEQFRVSHRYGQPDASDNYTVTHSAEIFLIDPQTRIVAKFTPPISIQQVTQQYGVLVDYFQPKKEHV